MTVGTFAVLSMLALSANATNSRVDSMAANGRVSVLDDTNIFALPAEVVKYGSWVSLDLGAGGDTSFGVHYNFNPTTVLALYGSNEKPTFIDDVAGQGVFQDAGAGNAGIDGGETHKFIAILGMDFGNSRLGILLGAHGDGAKQMDGDGNVQSNMGPMQIDLGIGYGMGLGSGDLDLALHAAYGTVTQENNDGSLADNSQIDIGLLGRLTMPFSGPHELVAWLGIAVKLPSGKVKDGNEVSGMHFGADLGADVRLNLGDGITVQPGVGFMFAMESHNNGADPATETSSMTLAPYYHVAVDVAVNEWLDIRFGGSQMLTWASNGSTTDGNSNGDSSSSDVAHSIATGVGFNLPAGVSIDVQVNTGWWKQGPYFLTGNAGDFGASAAISKDW
jgi:hypothetical protein